MEIERQTVVQDPATGSREVVHTAEHIPSMGAVEEAQADRVDAYIWYIVALIEILLVLRTAFLLLGAKNTGFTSILYSVTYPLVALFKGIFPAPNSTTGYFETAAILAMVMYALIGWGIVSLIDISKRGKVA